MPLTGLADVPIRPQMRDDTVTKRNPKITTKSDAIRFSKPDVRAPAIGLNVSISHIEHDDAERAEDDPLHGDITVEPAAAGLLAAGLLRADVLDAAPQRVDDRRHRLDQRDEPGHGDGAGAHRADVAFPHLARRHRADRDGARIERFGRALRRRT